MPSNTERPTSEVLDRASRRLDEHGWCQFDLALTYDNGSPPQLCLDAALLYGVGISVPVTGRVRTDNSNSGRHRAGYVFRDTYNRGSDPGETILRHLTPRLRNTYLKAVRYLKEVTGAPDLADWNDEEFRSVEEVQDALRQARELALADEEVT